MKFLLVNWANKIEQKGGCETMFSQLGDILQKMGHEVKMVTYMHAMNCIMIGYTKNETQFFEVEGSHIIDRYCSHYQKLYHDTHIISNAGITNVWYKHKDQTNIFNDPYKFILNKLSRKNLSGTTDYNKYAHIATIVQRWSSEGANNIAISKFMEEEMRNIGVEPTKTIPLGVDMELFRPMDKDGLKEKYGIPKGMKVAIWSKEFNPVSGFHIISKLVKEFDDIFWVLNFKNGNNSRYIAKNVKIVQPMEFEKMPELYNLADFCINCSVTESFGLVPLEAMSCDIPCVMTNTGFVWEKKTNENIAKRDYGVLVNSWDSKHYSDAIKLLLENRFTPRKFAENFSIDKWRASWKEYIDGLCKKKH
jgi:glycosyltransferase involved in cell wall biosynthesis